MKKILGLFLLLAVFCCSASANTAIPYKNQKFGYLYIGPVGDAGFTYMHEKGREYMHEKLPELPKSTIVESVPEGPDSLRTIEMLIRRGHNVIVGNSFGYMDYLVEAAKKHPDVYFMHCSGYKSAPNMGTYFGRMYQARYLSGMAAGAMGDKIGFVGSFPIPEVVRAINAFTLGARAVNPKATVQVVWIYSWLDPGKEKEATKALIDSGCKVIGMHADTGATPQTCEESDVYVVGYNNDMRKFAPKMCLTSAVWNWGIAYAATAEAINNGTWTNDPIWWGLDKGMVDITDFGPAVPEETRNAIMAVRDEIKSGDLHIFTGPIKDQKGELKIPGGKQMSDGELLGMDWFVEGVEGSIK